jgi:hypothetical protein
MLLALQRYRDSYQISIEVVDVDSDEALVAQFDELVPVLCGKREGQAPVQLCHYFLDAGKLEQFLNQ